MFDGRALAQGTAPRLIGDSCAYAPEFQGGVFVAAGDLNNDGHTDIITGAGIDAPHVTAVSGLSLIGGGRDLLASFYAADPNNRGGVRVAARDLNSDRHTDIIAGAGTGDGSTVSSFSGQSLTQIGVARSRFAVERAGSSVANVPRAAAPARTHRPSNESETDRDVLGATSTYRRLGRATAFHRWAPVAKRGPSIPPRPPPAVLCQWPRPYPRPSRGG